MTNINQTQINKINELTGGKLDNSQVLLDEYLTMDEMPPEERKKLCKPKKEFYDTIKELEDKDKRLPTQAQKNVALDASGLNWERYDSIWKWFLLVDALTEERRLEILNGEQYDLYMMYKSLENITDAKPYHEMDLERIKKERKNGIQTKI